MSTHKSDSDWESFAREDPYWAVLTQDRFRASNLDENTKRDFFASGEEYIAWAFEMARKHVNSTFQPRTALDFGCGVGRLLIPLAARCQSAIGADVSDSMLREAQENCTLQGANNVRLIRDLAELSDVKGKLDFVNSFVVFQHIPCQRSLELLRAVLDLLGPTGVGAVHVTYSKEWYLDSGERFLSDYVPQEQISQQGFRWHLNNLKQAIKHRLKKAFAEKDLTNLLPRISPENGGAEPSLSCR